MAAALSGFRRPRASVPELGTRIWVVPPGPELWCSLCDEPFSRVPEREARARRGTQPYVRLTEPATFAASHAAVRPLVLPRLHHNVAQEARPSVPDWPLPRECGRKVRSSRSALQRLAYDAPASAVPLRCALAS